MTIMKQLSGAVALFLLAGVSAVYGQSTLPFPPDGEHLMWKYSRTGGMLLNAYDQYGYNGEDVEADGQVYKVIRRSHRWEVHDGPGTFYVDEAYGEEYCHLRTDDDGVTYMHSTEFPPEEILFDPAIDVGDTVPATWKLVRRDLYDEVVTVEAITTMLDEQGVTRRVWHFNTPDHPWTLTFIEGVGSTNEFLGLSFGNGPVYAELVCAQYDGLAIIGTTCTTISSVAEAANANTDPLRVSFDPGGSVYVLNHTCSGTIYDLVGRPVRQLQTASQFRLDGYSAGAYTLDSEEYGIARFVHP